MMTAESPITIPCPRVCPGDDRRVPHHFLSKVESFLIDHQDPPSHKMVMENTTTQSAPTWDWLDELGSKVHNAYDSFVVRAPKITLRSTAIVKKNTSTSTPEAQQRQILVRRSSLATYFDPPAPSSCATTQDHLINDSKRRILSFRRLPPIAKDKDSNKSGQESWQDRAVARAHIAVRTEIAELRLAVLKRDTAMRCRLVTPALAVGVAPLPAQGRGAGSEKIAWG
jgi:hypothetical protein